MYNMYEKIMKKNHKEIVEIYATILYQLSSDIDPMDNINIEYAYMAQEEPLKANSLIHKIHKAIPTIRDEAISLIANEFNAGIEVVFNGHLYDKTSQKPIPRISEAEEILDRFKDDIRYHYGITYVNNHEAVSDGIVNENVVIYIESASKETLESIKSLLEQEVRNISIS